MASILWKLPAPSSALWEGAEFRELAGRTCAILCRYDREDGLQMVFEGVEAYKCTYHQACTLEMIETAYDTLVDLGDTTWLAGVKGQLAGYSSDATELRHLMIYFDDGPCYELICRSFRVEHLSGDDWRRK